MTLLNVERIKLFSTRSPYWCLVAIAVAALGFATLFGLVDNGSAALPYLVLRGVNLGLSIFMVLAALSVTTEYRFGTIRNTFLAAPRRPAVLAAKTVVIAVIGSVIGLFVGLLWGWAVVTALSGQFVDQFSIPTTQLAVFVVVFAIAGVIAAIIPAWRASRLHVLEAIANE